MAADSYEAQERVMAGRTKPCPPHVRKGRRAKAEQFWFAATSIRKHLDDGQDLGDAFVTLCIHAGIAAADVVCCAVLNEHAHGESHSEAVALLRQADPALQNHLMALLSMKTRSGYSHELSGMQAVKTAERAANHLMTAARRA